MNGKILHNTSFANIIRLKRPGLKIEEVFNWQISKGKKVLMEIICKLSKEGSNKINELEDEKKNAFN